MGLVTVRDVLALPALRGGVPEVLAGGDHLDRGVRWMHLGELSNMSYYLKGGEVLLTAGAGIGSNPASRKAFVNELAEAGIAALIVELGLYVQELRSDFVKECEQAQLPLIVLHEQVPFVEVTHQVHSRIIEAQMSNLVLKQSLSDDYAELLLRGADVQEIVDLLAIQTVNPVMLTDHNNDVRAFALHGVPKRDAFAHWAHVARGGDVDDPHLRVSVRSSEGDEVGSLTILGMLSKLGDADQVALEAAARATSITTVRVGLQQSSQSRARYDFISDLLNGDVDEGFAALQATKLSFDAPAFVPIAIARTQTGQLLSGQEADALWKDFTSALERSAGKQGLSCLFSTREPGLTFVVMGLRSADSREREGRRFFDLVKACMQTVGGEGFPTTVCLGAQTRTWRHLGDNMRALRAVLPFTASNRAGELYDVTVPDVERVLWLLRDNQILRDFSLARLGPLIAYDEAKRSTLLLTLEALCEHGGRKAEAARSLHLERPSLYDRLARIESLLGVSLQDPEVMLGLHLALRAMRYLGDGKSASES